MSILLDKQMPFFIGLIIANVNNINIKCNQEETLVGHNKPKKIFFPLFDDFFIILSRNIVVNSFEARFKCFHIN